MYGFWFKDAVYHRTFESKVLWLDREISADSSIFRIFPSNHVLGKMLILPCTKLSILCKQISPHALMFRKN